VRVWDLRTGSLFKEFRGHTDTIYALSFNQSTSVLASGKDSSALTDGCAVFCLGFKNEGTFSKP